MCMDYVRIKIKYIYINLPDLGSLFVNVIVFVEAVNQKRKTSSLFIIPSKLKKYI